MRGILLIDKPKGFTSFDVVAKIRGMTRTKRVGHIGTLDPMATGVLPIFIGNATKACGMITNENKSYIADFQLGIKTDTLDKTGTVLSRMDSFVTKENILNTLTSFRGEISQIPPMYSAIKMNGKRLYELARQGKDVERVARKVFIIKLELLYFDETTQTGRLAIDCSKGTYIRTIIDDIGNILNVGGIMTELVRTVASGFNINQCISIEKAQELSSNNMLDKHILPVDMIFSHLQKITLDSVQTSKFKNGVQLDLSRINYSNSTKMQRIYDNNNDFIGISKIDEEQNLLILERMFI